MQNLPDFANDNPPSPASSPFYLAGLADDARNAGLEAEMIRLIRRAYAVADQQCQAAYANGFQQGLTTKSASGAA